MYPGIPYIIGLILTFSFLTSWTRSRYVSNFSLSFFSFFNLLKLPCLCSGRFFFFFFCLNRVGSQNYRILFYSFLSHPHILVCADTPCLCGHTQVICTGPRVTWPCLSSYTFSAHLSHSLVMYFLGLVSFCTTLKLVCVCVCVSSIFLLVRARTSTSL